MVKDEYNDLILASVQRTKIRSFCDLTHPFDSEIPHFNDSTIMQMDVIRNYQNNGFLVQKFQLEGQWGTHVDAPFHVREGMRSVDPEFALRNDSPSSRH